MIYYLKINVFFSRAPRDCVQYYTGAAGNLQSFGHAGSQLLQGMDYEICIRYFILFRIFFWKYCWQWVHGTKTKPYSYNQICLVYSKNWFLAKGWKGLLWNKLHWSQWTDYRHIFHPVTSNCSRPQCKCCFSYRYVYSLYNILKS